MKNLFIVPVVLLFSVIALDSFSQNKNVGIGTKNPEESAILDIQSPDKGLLIPRLSLEQRNGIISPAEGLLVYQNDKNVGFYYFSENKWKPLSGFEAQSVAAANADNWSKTGDAGTDPNNNFIGTTDGQPLVFKVQNTRSGYLENGVTFNTSFGFQANNNLTGTNNTAIGGKTLSLNTSGYSNTAIGSQVLTNNTTGYANSAFGQDALVFNTVGYRNMAIGSFALKNNTDGSDNIAVGNGALFNNISGINNVAIGSFAGLGKTGFGNLYLGYGAGQDGGGGSSTSESNKLYISNSNTTTPLIGGDFGTVAYGGSGNGVIKMHLGSGVPTNTTGYLAIGDFSATTPPVLNFGNGSGTNSSYRLIVQDGVLTEKVKVALKSTADWADYVFEPSYALMSLEDVEKFTLKNKHLPNVPSAEEMANGGLDVGETSKMFMEKIEELTLYMIELNKEVQSLKVENKKLKALIK
ncbi:hypothetical protein [Jiulongibacter sediminis]|uniref:hypothetical protein n=1 Tax=Jiulongibacter sediminis TaxID=1605367 RepID=UPI0026ECF225|nr:hypothetical protein [Jiulongibacter sediminis]